MGFTLYPPKSGLLQAHLTHTLPMAVYQFVIRVIIGIKIVKVSTNIIIIVIIIIRVISVSRINRIKFSESLVRLVKTQKGRELEFILSFIS